MLNKYSSHITQPKSQGASQAMLYGTGMTEADMSKPQVGIAAMWYDGNTCNMHLGELATRVKEGVTAAGMVGMRFNTIGVSDGISMGTSGMSYSLQSRDLIADSIETVMQAQWYDALVALPGCDKNMPGCLIAMGRLNRPAIMVYGGTIKPGFTASQKAATGGRAPGEPEKRDIVSPSNATASSSPAASPSRSAPTSFATPVQAPAPAAACTRPTRWRARSKPSACRCRTAAASPPSIPTN
jgi:dihydroxyacid dehydratase/phosphogluconate dehydratase